MTFDQNGFISSCNNAATELFKLDSRGTIGRHIHVIIPGLSWSKENECCVQRIVGRTSIGEDIPLRVSIGPLPSENSLVAIILDLTEAEKAERQRILTVRETEALRAQQMATLAQLATGVAHEIRNPLTSMKMMIQVNRDKFTQRGLPDEDLELVEQEIRRMERSVTSLLEYARPEPAEFVQFPLQGTIEKMSRLISGQCASCNVELKLELPDQPLLVFGDPLQIQQLLLNLCLNGLDAMPDGGTLLIRLEELETVARITVTDSGCGIQSDVLDKLFSPFVTTKPNGVGLGLGICRRIAELHSGRLVGFNENGRGATFQVDLPPANVGPSFDCSNGNV